VTAEESVADEDTRKGLKNAGRTYKNMN